ncbi:hypothetical protein DV702_12950 [Sporosarcina sp. PTS2304]|uniref:restriction endonuclease n=1 Tax=Sporosarcina sp. PTS2304 TaxID=2283194 RepID=UPI000E0CD108|nr:hypothetical protein [Sporosarcina sp. PTS2304]AXI00548.1 hypothetical protein DV702_12950 [Sporosarcina sp. PTS2304]
MKKNVWLLRPLPHGNDCLNEFLEENFIAVGYPAGISFSNLSYNVLRETLKNNNWEEGIGNVNILVNSMQIGDLVVVPSTNKKDVYIGEITSDYVYSQDLDENREGTGYPHQRKVTWFFNKQALLRSDLPDELRSSLRYPGAVADLTKHYSLVEQLINGGIISIDSDLQQRAWKVIEDLLESDDENIRLHAATLILNK